MREPNFMMPKRSPARTCAPVLHAAHDAPREDADDLPRDDRLAVVIDPDLAALVASPASCRYAGRNGPAVIATRASRGPTTGMRLTCTSIGDRKMLICCHAPGGRRGRLPPRPATSTRPSAGDSTASIGGADGARPDRGRRRGRSADDDEQAAPSTPGEPTAPDTSGEHQRAADERPARRGSMSHQPYRSAGVDAGRATARSQSRTSGPTVRVGSTVRRCGGCPPSGPSAAASVS